MRFTAESVSCEILHKARPVAHDLPAGPRPLAIFFPMSRPTTLSARAAQRLTSGPLDPVTLMRDVCKVERLQADAAERMAVALLSSHPEFVRLPSGHGDDRRGTDGGREHDRRVARGNGACDAPPARAH